MPAAMTSFPRRIITLVGVSCLGFAFVPAILASSVADAACTTANPPSNYAAGEGIQYGGLNTDQEIQTNFTGARAAEGCNVPLALPAGYDAMTPQQQMLWVFNNEREVRGVPPLQLDSTLMSQIALNHSMEMTRYGYFNHPSPINQLGKESFANVARDTVNPVFAPDFFGEDIAAGNPTAAAAVFSYMYEDASSEWGHRGAILQGSFNWVGIGITPNPLTPNAQTYFTDDFGTIPAGYVPPARADTNPPVLGEVSYANGTATVTGVADSPMNVNDQGTNPLTAGITGVVFYTNNLVESPENSEQFNTVSAAQTAPGSGIWTAAITVNAGEVLHAVAVDGSGNFTDVSPPPPAMTLTAGANAIALPAGPVTPTATTTSVHQSSANVSAVTPTARALVASVDAQFKRKIVKDVRVYAGGHWRTYYPGKSHDFPLFTNEGVVLQMKGKGRWRPPAGAEAFTAPTIHLHRGWNFVAAPYPIVHMTCHATRLELARSGDKLEQITVGPARNVGTIMRPNSKGEWGNDLTKVIPDDRGFWIKDAGSATWVPSPVGYGKRIERRGKPLKTKRP
jgi:uncharacterized protein YkwD